MPMVVEQPQSTRVEEPTCYAIKVKIYSFYLIDRPPVPNLICCRNIRNTRRRSRRPRPPLYLLFCPAYRELLSTYLQIFYINVLDMNIHRVGVFARAAHPPPSGDTLSSASVESKLHMVSSPRRLHCKLQRFKKTRRYICQTRLPHSI